MTLKIPTQNLVIDTLRKINVGETHIIRTRDLKTESIRNAASKLKKENGWQYEVSVVGLIDKTRITRIK